MAIRSTVRIYGVTVAAVVAAVLLRWLLDPWLGDHLAFATLYGAVALAVWEGGYRPALLAVLLGFLACDWLFIAPRGEFILSLPRHFIGLILYSISCAVIIFFGEAMQAARRRAEASLVQVEEGITQRNRAEKALAKTVSSLARERERLAVALRTGQLGVYEWRLGEPSIWWSPEVYPVYGVEPESFTPTLENFSALVHPDDRAELWRKTEDCLAQRAIFTHEYRIIRPDGALRWIANHSHVGLDAAGAVERVTGVAVDVTERKQAEQALRESEARFRLATNAGAVGVWEWNIVSNTVLWSDTIYAIHGLKPDEYDGTLEAFAALIHPDDRMLVNEAIQRSLREGLPYEIEFRTTRPDGTLVWVSTQAQVVRDAVGVPQRLLGSTVDVTRRKQAEEKLRESEERQTFLLQLSDQLRSLADPIDIQYEAARLLGEHLGANRVGYAEDQGNGETVVVMRNYTAGVPSIEGRYRYDDYGSALLTELQAGHLIVRSDIANDPTLTGAEKTAYAALHLGAMVNVPLVKAGRLVGVLFVHNQAVHTWSPNELSLMQETAERLWATVERARAEVAVRASEARFRQVFDEAPVGMVQAELNGRVQQVNPAVCKLLGRPAEELIGMHPDELTPPEYYASDRDYFRCVVQEEASQPALEKEYIRGDGSRVWGQLTATLVRDAAGAPAYYIVIIEDITARKEVAETLRASEERYRNLLASIDQGFCVFEMIYDAAGQAVDYRFLEVNPTFERHTGLKDAVGKTAKELVPHLEAHWIEAYGQVAATGEARRFEQGSLDMGRLFDVEAARVGGDQSRKVALLLRDITENRRAEERLRESEARFRNMADYAPVMVWVTEADGSCTYLSQSWYEFTGQTPEIGLGGGWLQAIHPDEQSATYDAFVSANATESWFCIEYRLRRQDGTYAWALDSARPHLSASGEFLGYIGSVIDISERKHIEEQLRASQRELQLLADAMPQVVWMANAQGTVNYYNRRVQEFDGITENADGTWNWQPVVHPNELAATSEAWQTAVSTGQPYVKEHRLRMKDGSFRWHLSRAFPSLEPSGKIVKWYGTATDIHDIKLAEEKIQLANYRFRVAEEAAKGLNFDWDLETGLVTRSKSLEHVLGYQLEEFAPTWDAWAELIYPDDRLLQTEAEARALLASQTEDLFGSEYRVRHKAGHYVWMLERGLILRNEHGQPRRVIGQMVDISERKQSEQEREELLQRERYAREQAEAATHAKDEFIAVVSHELRTPLNAILGYNRMLQKPEQLTATEHAKFTAIVDQSARRQLKLIEDLLDTARFISGKLRLEKQPCAFAWLVKMAVEEVRPTAEAKQVTLVTELDEMPTPLLGDPERLQQIVWNLLSNALKFTPAGGAVIVRLTQHAAQAQLTVTDTGQGIAPNVLPFIFDRFRQADSSSSRRYGGLGLGLALVKQLTELHGGTITAASAGVGQGSTFTLCLPLHSPTNTVHLPPSATTEAALESAGHTIPSLTTGSQLAGLRVLVVDDEPEAREIIGLLLQAQGARVTPLASATAALALLTNAAQEMPDVLVSDIGMPEMDGYELLQQIRTQGLRIPAIALTAFGRAEDRLRALTAGFQMHVPKPVEPEELITVLASLTGRLSTAPDL